LVQSQSPRFTGTSAVEPISATLVTRSGFSAARVMATIEPSEWPATAAFSTFIASRNRRASSAKTEAE
jgi:hypothetical protein